MPVILDIAVTGNRGLHNLDDLDDQNETHRLVEHIRTTSDLKGRLAGTLVHWLGPCHSVSCLYNSEVRLGIHCIQD